MMLRFSVRIGLMTAAIAVCLAACNNGQPIPEGYPQPGNYQVVEVAPLKAQEEKDLLRYGSFEDFWAGAPTPGGPFVVPQHSKIRREQQYVGEGSTAAFEEWEQPDWGTPPSEHFGVFLQSLKPRTKYKFSCQAETQHNFDGYLEFYLEGGPGEAVSIGEIPFKPEKGYKPYTFTFDTGEFTQLRVASYGPEYPQQYPTSVFWDDWRLEEAGKDDPLTPPSPPLTNTGGMIQNGSFENWTTGIFPPPGSFAIPPPGDTIIYNRESREPATGRYALRGVWTKADTNVDLMKGFATARFTNVEQNKDFTLTFKSKFSMGVAARVLIYAFEDSGKPSEILGSTVLETGPDYKEYTIAFNTKGFKAFMIVLKGPWENTSTFPTVVLWDDFHLE